jgi:hypothetical protein
MYVQSENKGMTRFLNLGDRRAVNAMLQWLYVSGYPLYCKR